MIVRIGVLDLSVTGWTAGGIFTRVVCHGLARAVAEEPGVELSFISNNPPPKGLPSAFSVEAPVSWVPLSLGQRVERRLGRYRQPNWIELTMEQRKLDVVLPVVYAASTAPTKQTTGKQIGWIPDFQHLYLPEFFEPGEITQREEQCELCVETSAKMLLSSEDSLNHFRKRFPAEAAKGEAIPFPSIFGFEPPSPVTGDVRKKFNLPEVFVMVANQFWAHKNHLTVVRALEALKKRGIKPTFVFTGQLGDHRNGGDCVLSGILQEAAALGVYDQLRVLGLVSRADLLDLIRTAAAVLQPSRWEGWSTTVQDAKALGRPVICSDLPVHREQAPEALFFFEPLNPEDLAAKLETALPHLIPGPDSVGEQAALGREAEFARAYGRKLLEFCRSAGRTDHLS